MYETIPRFASKAQKMTSQIHSVLRDSSKIENRAGLLVCYRYAKFLAEKAPDC